MEESKEREREVLLKKIEQTRPLFAATTDERKVEGATELRRPEPSFVRWISTSQWAAVLNRRTPVGLLGREAVAADTDLFHDCVRC